jgi:hypothetical protein
MNPLEKSSVFLSRFLLRSKSLLPLPTVKKVALHRHGLTLADRGGGGDNIGKTNRRERDVVAGRPKSVFAPNEPHNINLSLNPSCPL